MKSKRKFKKYLKTINTQPYKIYGMQQKHPRREVHSDTGLPQKKRKISNNLTYHLKELEKEETQPNVSRRKEIIKRGNK